MKNDLLTFDEEKHEYRLGALLLPSVTQIIKGAGFIDDTHYNEFARLRGTFVHKSVKLYLNGRLNESNLDPVIQPYFLAFKDWESKIKPNYLQVETPSYNAEFQFAGTADLVIEYMGFVWIVDIKTGPPDKWHGQQTAGYTMLKSPFKAAKRAGLHLSKEGKFNFMPHDNKMDLMVFKSACIVHNRKLGRV